MTITQLKYIVAVDNHRHFAKAAEACFVTQPTLSMQLQKLEEGVRLREVSCLGDRAIYVHRPHLVLLLGPRRALPHRCPTQQVLLIQNLVVRKILALRCNLMCGTPLFIAHLCLVGFVLSMSQQSVVGQKIAANCNWESIEQAPQHHWFPQFNQ